MESLINTIEKLEHTARIPAMRGLVHATMTRTIRGIQRHIRVRERNQRQGLVESSLDERNEADINAQADESAKRAMGFEIAQSPIELASQTYCVYDWASTQLKTLTDAASVTSSNRMQALTVTEMLKFMASPKPKANNVAELKALAELLGESVETIEFIQRLNDERQHQELVTHQPEIEYTFKSFGEVGCETSFDDLPIVEQHQIAVKVIDALKRYYEQTLAYVITSRRYLEMGTLALVKDGITQLTKWFAEFETRHRGEISRAIEEGRMLRAVDDFEVELKQRRARLLKQQQ